MPGSDCALALRLAAEHGVPQGQRFQLLCRIRAARCAATAEGRYVHTKRRLLVVFSLLHLLASEHERLEAMLLVSDPELLPDLVALVGGAAAPRPALRTLALKCLSTAVRSRFMTAIEVMTKPQHRRLVPNLVHGAVAALLADAQQAGHLLAPPQGVTLPPPPVQPVIGGVELMEPGGELDMHFVESVFSLLAALSGHVSECGMTDAALVTALLPLLQDAHPRHATLLGSVLRLLEAFMEIQTGADAAFRDGQGVQLLIHRLRAEVDPAGQWGAPAPGLPPLTQGDTDMATDGVQGEPQAGAITPAAPPPAAAAEGQASPPPVEAADVTPASHASRSVVKGLLRCVGLSSLTLRAGGGASLDALLEPNALAPCLVAIYRQPRTWGNAVFALGMSLLADIVHSSPTSYAALHTAGVPTALVNSLVHHGVPGSSDTIVTVPTVLGALCLHPAGLAMVLPPQADDSVHGATATQHLGALQCVLAVLVSKDYVRVMQHGDTADILAPGLDELMRHVPQLRAPGVRMLVTALRTLAIAAGADVTPPSTAGGGEAMDADPVAPAAAPAAEDAQGWVCDALANLARVLEGVLPNAEACRLFVDEGGIQLLLAAVSAPAVMAQFTAASSWQATTTAIVALQGVFRIFGANHMPQVATHLREALTTALQRTREASTAAPLPSPGPDAPAMQLSPNYRRWLAACESLLNVAMTTLRGNSATLLAHGFLGSTDGDSDPGDRANSDVSVLALCAEVERTVVLQAVYAEECRRMILDTLLSSRALATRCTSMLDMVMELRTAMAEAHGSGAPTVKVDALETPLCVYLRSFSDATHAAATQAQQQQGSAGGPAPAAPPPPKADAAELCTTTCRMLAESLFPLCLAKDGDAAQLAQLEAARTQVAALLRPLLEESAQGARVAAVAGEITATLSRFEAASRAFMASINKVISSWHRMRSSAPAQQGRALAWSMATESVTALTQRVDAPRLGQATIALFGHPESSGMPLVRGMSEADVQELGVRTGLRYLSRALDALGALLFDSKHRGSRLANALLLNYVNAVGGGAAVAGVVQDSFQACMQHQQQPGAAHEPLPDAIDDALCCGGAALEALCNVPFLVSGSGTADLLSVPPPAGMAASPGARTGSVDALSRGLHQSALRELLPMWRHQGGAATPARFVQSVLACMAHIARGIPGPTAPAGGAENAPPTQPAVPAALIARFVDMGFVAARVEDAVRRVSARSGPRPITFEAVFEWLVTHDSAEVAAEAPPAAAPQAPPPSEAGDGGDDLLAALAMSLQQDPADGGAGPSSATRTPAAAIEPDEEVPPPEQLLTGVIALVQAHPGVVHSASDLLLAVVRRQQGAQRAALVSDLVARFGARDAAAPDLAALSHILLLLLMDDPACRSTACADGLPLQLLRLLEGLTAHPAGSNGEVPAGATRMPLWTSSAVLMLEVLAQWRPAGSDGSSDAAPTSGEPHVAAAAGGEGGSSDDATRLNRLLGRLTGHLSEEEQARCVQLCVQLLRLATATAEQKQAVGIADSPASVCHAALSLACRLTKGHALALAFHNAGGTQACLHLPHGCLFPGFDLAVAALLRHILEDPATLRLAMEAEIRGAFAAPNLVRAGCRVSPRSLLAHLAHVMGRDPATFCDALCAVTTVDESHGGRVMLVLVPKEQQAQQQAQADAAAPGAGSNATAGEAPAPVAPATASTRKAAGKVASSFVSVIDALVGLVCAYPLAPDIPAPDSMNVDVPAATAAPPPPSEPASAPQPPSPSPADLAAGRAGFALRCLTDCLLLYHSTAAVLLRRDGEAQHAGAQRPLLAHVLHALLPAREAQAGETEPSDAVCRVSDRAVFFLLALCVRSAEGRRRVISGVAAQLQGAQRVRGRASAPGLVVLVDLVNSLVAARKSPNSPADGAAGQSGISGDMMRAMRDAHMVRALTAALRQVDLDHPGATACVTAILRPLEALTRACGPLAPPPAPTTPGQAPGTAQNARGGGQAAAPTPGLGIGRLGTPAAAARPRTTGETPTPTRRPGPAPTPGTVGLDTAPLEQQVAAVSEMAASLFHNESRRRRNAGGRGARAAVGAGGLAMVEEGAHDVDAHMEAVHSSDSDSLVSGERDSEDDDELMLDDDGEEEEEEGIEVDDDDEGGGRAGDQSMSDLSDSSDDDDGEGDDPGDGGAAFRRHLARHLAEVMDPDGVGHHGDPDGDDDGMDSPPSSGEEDDIEEDEDLDEGGEDEDIDDDDEEDELDVDEDDAAAAFDDAVRAVEDALRGGGDGDEGGPHGSPGDGGDGDIVVADSDGDGDGDGDSLSEDEGDDGEGVEPDAMRNFFMRHARRHLGDDRGELVDDEDGGLERHEAAAMWPDMPSRGANRAVDRLRASNQAPQLGGEAIEIRWRDANGRVGSTAAMIPPQMRLGQPGGVSMQLLQSLVADTAQTVPPGSAAFAAAFQEIVDSVMSGAMGQGRRHGLRAFGDEGHQTSWHSMRAAADDPARSGPPGSAPRHPLLMRSAPLTAGPAPRPESSPAVALANTVAAVAGDVARLASAPAVAAVQAVQEAWASVPSLLEPPAAIVAPVQQPAGQRTAAGGDVSDPLTQLFGLPTTDARGGAGAGAGALTAAFRRHRGRDMVPPGRLSTDGSAPASLFNSLASRMVGAPPSGPSDGWWMGADDHGTAGATVSDPRRALWGDEAMGGASPALLTVQRLEDEAVARVRAAHPAPPPPPAREGGASDLMHQVGPEPTQAAEQAAAPVSAPDVVMTDSAPPPAAAAPPEEGAAPETVAVEPLPTPMAVSEDAATAAAAAAAVPSPCDDEGEGGAVEEEEEEEPGAEEGDDAEVDPSFLDALPPELRVEVLAQQAAAGVQRQAQRAARVRARQERLRAATAEAAAADGGGPAPGAPSQDAQPGADAAAEDVVVDIDIDPEFLAALPPELAAEVLAEQQAAVARQRAAARAPPSVGPSGAGGDGAAAPGADMDFATLIASFPPDVREEALVEASDEQIASLPPAQQAEAAQLRERAQRRGMMMGMMAQRHGGGRAGMPPPGLVSTRAIQRAANDIIRSAEFIGNLEPGGFFRGAGARVPGARGGRGGAPVGDSSGRPTDVDGDPLLDDASLDALVRLLRLASPVPRSLLTRLLLHLCGHKAMRARLLGGVLSLVRDDPAPGDGALRRTLFGSNAAAVAAREPQVGNATPHGCWPPVLVGRALDVVASLARHHSRCAQLLTRLAVPPCEGSAAAAAAAKGKSKAGGPRREDVPALVLLLHLLTDPVKAHRNGHLLPTLQLLDSAFKESSQVPDASASASAAQPPPAAPGADGAGPSNAMQVTTAAAAAAPGGSDAAAQAAPAESEGDAARKAAMAEEQSVRSAARAAIADTLSSAHLSPLVALLVSSEINTVEAQAAAGIIATLPHVHPGCVPGVNATLAQLVATTVEQLTAALSALNAAVAATGAQSAAAMMPAGSEALLQSGPGLLRLVKCVMKLQRQLSKANGVPVPNDPPPPVDADGDEAAQAAQPVVHPPAEVVLAAAPLWAALEASAATLEALVALSGAPPSGEAPVRVGERTSQPDAVSAAQPLLEAWLHLTPDGDSPPPGSLLGAQSSGGAGASQSSQQAAPAVGSAPSSGRAGDSQSAGAVALWHFMERHRRLINALVRAKPQLLSPEGSFRRLLHAPRLLDFDNKRSLLSLRLRSLAQQERAPSLRLVVRRPHVLTDSYQQLHLRTPGEMRGRLSVSFHGEEGVDAGGVSREWYSILARAMFDPSFALFVPSVGGDATFQPNKDSAINPEHLSYFTFCGRVVGKALLDGQLLDAYFTRSFYKHILRQPVLVEDIEAIDPEYYTALKWMLDNDITGVLDHTFVAEEEYFGARNTVELKPGGASVAVTEENKREYVQLITAHRMTGAIKQQTDAFTRGFNDLVPHRLLSMFNAQELELLISGLPEIDIDDLQANTEYHGGFTPTSPVVAWFWSVVRGLSKEDLARLLMFVTGSSKVPLGGFSTLQGISGPQKFQIHKAYGGSTRLCSAHTCFNQLDLPEYSSAEELKERLLTAIHEGGTGFGFA